MPREGLDMSIAILRQGLQYQGVENEFHIHEDVLPAIIPCHLQHCRGSSSAEERIPRCVDSHGREPRLAYLQSL